MIIFKVVPYILILISFAITNIIPAYSDELDDQCRDECINSNYEDGHYLPPEPDAQCREGYEPHPTDEICCCK